MNANELMTGDLVRIKDLKDPIKRLVCVDEYLGKVDFLDGEDLFVTSIINVLPIPLTPKILEKNGFTENGINFNYRYLAIGDFEVYIYLSKNNTQLIIEKRYGTRILNILNIGYVHQLQHALRLCGIDKEIKLED